MVQILYYYGAMQWVVLNLGWLLQKSMGTTVCESVNAAASIFLGMVIIQKYLKTSLLSRSM
jgi:pyrimidine nucleoside transport protein